MAYIENSPDSVPIPALLVERATALARAEAGLALVHIRRVAVAAVSALLGTIVACAFAQLTIVLLVAWPVLASSVPLSSWLLGLLASVVLMASGAAFAVTTWLGVVRQRKHAAREAGANRPSLTPQHSMPPEAPSARPSAPPRGVELAARVGS